MASSRDYFEIEHSRHFCIDHPIKMNLKMQTPTGESHSTEFEVGLKIILDTEANATYPTYYIPEIHHEIVFRTATFLIDNKSEYVDKAVREIIVKPVFLDKQGNEILRVRPSNEYVDTGQMIIYTDSQLPATIKDFIFQYGQKKRIFVQIRDENYIEAKALQEGPVAFISHDSRDKESIARPLAVELSKQLMQPVWFDEFSLNVGDNLRESIERGIKECKKCVLILTPNFLTNSGWTKNEFDSIFTREIIERTNVVLPIWADVSAKDIYDYSPALANKVGVQWNEGVETVAQKLKKAILKAAN